MSWFIYAFVCALCLATADALSKKALDDNIDPYVVACKISKNKEGWKMLERFGI
jgi:hypothetical protein